MAETCIVTVAHGRHTHLQHQLRLLAESDPGSSHVVVAIADRGIPPVVHSHRGGRDVDVISVDSHPLGLPLASARNVGVRHALARGADLVVLLDVDCVLGAGALRQYAEAATVEEPALLCGPVSYLTEGTVPPVSADRLRDLRSPHPARPDPARGELMTSGDHNLFWSLNAALTPATWSSIGGFCEDYVGYGGEDTDFGWTARSRGIDLVWVGGADAYHQHHPVSSPPVEHLDAIVRNARLFHQRWGRWPMLGWLDAFAELGLVRFDGEELLTLSP
ncbi:MAG: galactosyltransferase-related protein [Ornithinimicrobium sp.]